MQASRLHKCSRDGRTTSPCRINVKSHFPTPCEGFPLGMRRFPALYHFLCQSAGQRGQSHFCGVLPQKSGQSPISLPISFGFLLHGTWKLLCYGGPVAAVGAALGERGPQTHESRLFYFGASPPRRWCRVRSYLRDVEETVCRWVELGHNGRRPAQRISQFGEIVEAKVITDRGTGRSRGFGFVTFANDEGATKAITEMDGTELDGRTIKVNEAEDKPARSGGGGGGRGGYGGGRGGRGGGRGGRGGGGGGGRREEW